MQKKLFSIIAGCTLSFFSVNAFSYSYQSDSTTETIALTNDPAPDTIFSFYSFSTSVLNNGSDLAFYALGYIPNTFIYRDGIWFHDHLGSTSLLAVRFGNVPGHLGLQFDDVRDYFFLNENGQVLFASSLTGSGVDTSNDFAIFFREFDGTISMLAREGDPAPGWPGSPPFDGFFGIQGLSNNAESVFTGWVNLGPHPVLPEDIIRPGIWKITSLADIELIAKDGDSAPGTSGVFGAFGRAYISDSGVITFEGRATPGLAHGVWRKPGSNPIEKIAYEGDAAPLIAGAQLGKSGTSSTPLMNAVMNNNANIALFSIISGAGVNAGNDHAIWYRSGGGGYQLVAREGDAAPGIGGGVTIAALMDSDGEPTAGKPKLNNGEQVVYTGLLAGAGVTADNNNAIWRWEAGSSTLIARSGNSVAGLQAGESIASVPLNGSHIQLNDNGEVLFEAMIAGPSVTAANDQALILASPIYGTSVFLREGDTMEVAPGDNRVVTDYMLEGNPGLNSASQVSYTTGFPGDTFGLFVTSPSQVLPPTCDVEDDESEDSDEHEDHCEDEEGHEYHHHHGHHHHHEHHRNYHEHEHDH